MLPEDLVGEAGSAEATPEYLVTPTMNKITIVIVSAPRHLFRFIRALFRQALPSGIRTVKLNVGMGRLTLNRIERWGEPNYLTPTGMMNEIKS